jgi:NAD(P)-dependent dehydrogenase (short-subunit alcohol dehydrogenase family)
MADSFFFREGARRASAHRRRRVLVTGALGNIGSYFCEHAHDKYDLTLTVMPGQDASRVKAYGRVVPVDLGDLAGLGEACRGIDTVLHLAAAADPDTPWDTLAISNVEGTYNLFVAARAAECRRVIYASSIHAVSGYPLGRQIQPDDPVNPGDLYGVSKCFGEAMGRYMAQQQGLSCIVLRIGAFQPPEAARDPKSTSMLDAWVSPRDLLQLIEKSIDNEDLQFAILHGLSNNAFNRMDITETKELVGYEPVDDLTREHPELQDLKLGEQLSPHNEQRGQEPGIREELEEVRSAT